MSDKCRCGGWACVTWYTENGSQKYRVFCTKCGYQTQAFSTKEEAIKAWEKEQERRRGVLKI